MKEVWEVLDPPQGAVVYWFARKPGSNQLHGSWAESPYGLYRIASRFMDHNVYVGLNPARRTDKLRICRSDVLALQTILIDVDPVQPEYDALAASREYLERANLLLGTELYPAIIDSGRGIQLWLRFERVGLPSEDSMAGWEYAIGAFLRALAGTNGQTVCGCRVDSSCHDLPRLARLPGSVNQKTLRPVRLLERGRVHGSDLLVRLGGLGERLDPAPVRARADELHSWQRAYSGLTVTARRFITEGVVEPGRHSACFAAAASMKENGVRFESCVQAIRLGASLCQPALPEPDAIHAAKNAYRGRKGGDQNWKTRWLAGVGKDHRVQRTEERENAVRDESA